MKHPIERRQGGRSSEVARGMSDFQRGMDRLFDEIFSSWGQIPAWNLPMARDMEQVFSPQCDIEEMDDEYLMTFDLPGVSKDDVHVDVNENLLTVTAEKKSGDWTQAEGAEEKRGRRNPRLQERFYGRYQRSFTLPPGTDIEHMQANYENGVLSLHVPKAPGQKPRRIQIQEGVAAPRAGLKVQSQERQHGEAETGRGRKTGT